MPAGLASGLPAGWEWDYDGTRWFYIFKANGHIQYHFPSEGDEFPDFIDSCEPAPDLNPEERLESHQQVKRVTGVAPVVERKKKKKKAENGMTATARPVGIEWDGDVGEGSSSEEEGKKAVFQPENLMFLGPQTYAEVSPLNEDEDEAAKRTVVGVVKGAGEGQGLVVSPAETTSAGTPAANKAELVRDVEKRSESGRSEAADVFIVSEAVVMAVPDAADEKPTVTGEQRAVEQAKPVEAPVDAPVQQESAPTTQAVSSLAQQESKSVAQPASSSAQQEAVVSAVAEAAAPSPPPPPPPPPRHEPTPQQHATPVAVDEPPQCYELPAPDAPFNPVGVIAEMPTEDTPRSHIEINPIPVEIMDSSVLAPIERVAPLGVAELPASADAVVKQTLPPPPPQNSSVHQQQQQRAPPQVQMKIKRKPTDPNASIPSPMSASSSAVMSPAIVSPPSAASPSPAAYAPASTTPPLAPPAGAPAAPQYRPYAPVSPLHRAATEPVSVPAATRPVVQQQAPLAQSATAPPSPVANPQLNYAPTVLRPAGQSRKSLSVSPERKHDDDVDGGVKRREATGQLTVAPTGGPVPPNETPNKAAASVPPGPMPQQGQVPPLGQAPAQVQIIPQGQMLPQAAASQQGQPLQPGQMPPHQHIPSQGQTPPQWQAPQNAMHLPAQHGRPMSMAPGQYPPVPIPQPYGQYQHQAPPMSQQPRPPWMAPGQPNAGQNYTTPTPQQQQHPPRWMRQSMPPGPPSGQQPPNARHSMMAQSVPGLAAHGSQYRPAPSLASPPSQPLASHRASTPDASTISPLRPRADSQPSGLSLPTPSPMEAPRVPSAAQPAAALPPREQPKRDSVKVGMGSRRSASTPGVKTSTADSYFPPSKEHPVGLVGNIADQFAAEMQAILGSSSATSRAAPVTNAAAEAKPEPKSLAGTPSPGPGYMLGRIEEHETETISVSESSKQDSRPSSVATKLTQPSSHPSTAQLQPQQPTPSQQSSPENTPQPPHGFLPPMNGQPGVAAPGSAAGTTPPGQMIPPGPMYPMPPQSLALQQQWQGNMQRPSSVPPQMHMQPNKGKENKWTKWFKSSKPDKNPGAPQGGIQQQQPPPQGWGQPQQWQPGPPMPGHAMQRPPMQGQPTQRQSMHGPIPGQPMQGQPIQGQPIQRQSMHGPIPGQPIPGQPMQGQPMQRPLMGGSMPTQNMPTNVYPPHQRPTGPGQGPMPQMMTQPHPLGSHPPQQYMPLQPAQPMPMRPAHGSHMQQSGGPMMQMAPPGGPGSPAPSQMIPSQNLSQLQGQAASPMLPTLMPAPLSLRPKSGAPAGVPGSG